MNNFNGQPLPPGVQSYTQYSSVPSPPIPSSSYPPYPGNPPNHQFQLSNTQSFYHHATAPQYNVGPHNPIAMGQNPKNTLNGSTPQYNTVNPSGDACQLGSNDSSNLQDNMSTGAVQNAGQASEVGHYHELTDNNGESSDPLPPTSDKQQPHELCIKTEGFDANSGGNYQSTSSDVNVLHNGSDSAYAVGVLPCSVNKWVETASDIERAAQDAVLREQERATQSVIRNQRDARSATGTPQDGADIFSERRDPSAIKEHLLRMATEHRAEIASKRWVPAVSDKGNLEIGNGYGVPGGGAYYTSQRPEVTVSIDSEQEPAAKEMPEYLKQKLKARGILREKVSGEKPVKAEHEGFGSAQEPEAGTLPSGWVEARDPATGSAYYYNESSGTSQWERPQEKAPDNQPSASAPLPENWIEALDETTGHKYYYNKVTHISQWEYPGLSPKVVCQNSGSFDSGNEANGNIGEQLTQMNRCMGCGGWGLGVVQSWGYCKHCTRVRNLPQSQYLLANLNNQQFGNRAQSKDVLEKKNPNQRSSSKPPMGRGKGRMLFSSRVNDGICDCCDGSDEYDGKVMCPNTCWEAGKVARDKLKRKIATFQDGVTIRKQEVEKAKISLEKDKEELSRLKDEEKVLKGLVQQLQDRKEQIEKAEEKERLQREKEEKGRREAEEKAEREKRKSDVEAGKENKEGKIIAESVGEDTQSQDDEKIGLLDDYPLDENVVEDFHDEAQMPDTVVVKGLQANEAVQHVGGDGDESVPTSDRREPSVASKTVLEAETEPSNQISAEGIGASDNTEGLSKEELGRLVASRWTGEKVEKDSVEGGSAGTRYREEMPKDAGNEENDSYASKNEDDGDHDNDDDGKYEYDVPEDVPNERYGDPGSYEPKPNGNTEFSDVNTENNPSWLDKIKQTVQNILQAFNLIKQIPLDKSEADRVRQEYESSNAKLSKIQSRISTLSEKLKHDFGPEKEFYSFYGHCFESKQNKYTYKVCPFKEATQEEGYSKTRLGDWDKFEESYKVMVFANGDRCWNGPDRSLKVRLRCGLTNEITDVDEPSRCEYVAFLSTPALCVEDKLKELQHKLDLMNREQPRGQGHDEL